MFCPTIRQRPDAAAALMPLLRFAVFRRRRKMPSCLLMPESERPAPPRRCAAEHAQRLRATRRLQQAVKA